jgi:hypothetical protein
VYLNEIERSLIVCETQTFSVDESRFYRQPLLSEPKRALGLSEKLVAQEKEMIEAALRDSGGRVSGPAGAAADQKQSSRVEHRRIRGSSGPGQDWPEGWIRLHYSDVST